MPLAGAGAALHPAIDTSTLPSRPFTLSLPSGPTISFGRIQGMRAAPKPTALGSPIAGSSAGGARQEGEATKPGGGGVRAPV